MPFDILEDEPSTNAPASPGFDILPDEPAREGFGSGFGSGLATVPRGLKRAGQIVAHAADEDYLKSALSSYFDEEKKAPERGMAYKVGNVIGNLIGSVGSFIAAEAAGLGLGAATTGPGAIATGPILGTGLAISAFGASGAGNAFFETGARALGEGKTIEEALSIAKKNAAARGVIDAALATFIPGGKGLTGGVAQAFDRSAAATVERLVGTGLAREEAIALARQNAGALGRVGLDAAFDRLASGAAAEAPGLLVQTGKAAAAGGGGALLGNVAQQATGLETPLLEGVPEGALVLGGSHLGYVGAQRGISHLRSAGQRREAREYQAGLLRATERSGQDFSVLPLEGEATPLELGERAAFTYEERQPTARITASGRRRVIGGIEEPTPELPPEETPIAKAIREGQGFAPAVREVTKEGEGISRPPLERPPQEQPQPVAARAEEPVAPVSSIFKPATLTLDEFLKQSRDDPVRTAAIRVEGRVFEAGSHPEALDVAETALGKMVEPGPSLWVTKSGKLLRHQDGIDWRRGEAGYRDIVSRATNTPLPRGTPPPIIRGSVTSQVGPRLERPKDIIDDIIDVLGMRMSLASARQIREKFKPTGAARRIFTSKEDGRAVDDVLSGLHGEGLHRRLETEDDLLQAVEDAIGARRGRKSQATGEEKLLATEIAEQADFEKAIKAKTPGVAVNELFIGDQFELAGEKVRVKDLVFDQETQDLAYVVLEDGRRFGVKTVSGEEVIHPDTGSLKQVPRSAEFLPPEEFKLAEPETVEQQKARFAAQSAAAQRKSAQEGAARQAAEPLAGTTGDLGQGDLLGAPTDLFAPPTPKLKDRVETFLDSLKSGVNPKAGDLGTANIVPRIWDALIEQIRLAYQGGKALAAAIEDGIAWLKTAHPTQRFDESELRLELQAEMAGVGRPAPGEVIPPDSGQSTPSVPPRQAPLPSEPPPTASRPPPDATPERIVTQAFGRPDLVTGRHRLTGELDAASFDRTGQTFVRAGLQPEPRGESEIGAVWGLVNESTPQEAQGHRLYDEILGDIRRLRQGNPSFVIEDHLGVLINSVRTMLRRMDLAEEAGEAVAFSKPLRQDLYSLVQGEASLRGLLLRALRNDALAMTYIARDVGTSLRSVYFESFGGEQARDILKQIETAMRQHFTPQEIADALAGKVDFETMFSKLTLKDPSTPPPKLADLVRQVLETPFYRQDEITQRFVDLVQSKFDLSKEEAKKLRDGFVDAFMGRLNKARDAALKKAQASLTPNDRAILGAGRPGVQAKPLWKKLEQAVNAGVFDVGEVMEAMAKERHWVIPTPEQRTRMRKLAEREQRLRELTPEEKAAAGVDPAVQAAKAEEKAAAFSHQRADLMREMVTLWSRWTNPINPLQHWSNAEITYANARAVNEMVSANLLLKFGFATRQMFDIVSQGGLYTPTRAIAHGWARWIDDRNAGRETRVFQDMGDALVEAYRARTKTWGAVFSAGRTAATGRGQLSDMLQPEAAKTRTSIAIFDRAMVKADELAAQGNHVGAFLTRMFTFMRFGYRIAQVLDAAQGTHVEYQEMHHQAVTLLRAAGKSRAEATAGADKIFEDVRADQAEGVAKAQELFDRNGEKSTPVALQEAAWQMAKSRAYTKLKALGQPGDNPRQANEDLRQTVGWNQREDGGLGGTLANIFRGGQDLFARIGLPFPPFSFGNAMGIAVNRKLTWLGLPLLPNKIGEAAFAKSPWFATPTDRLQRRVEATIGATMLPILVGLASAGAIVVRSRWPTDQKERERWIAEGRKPGTVEFPLGDGKFFPVSLTTGPLAYFSPELALGGAIYDLAVGQEKKQQKLNEEAAKKGLMPGKAEPVSPGEWLGVGMSALWNAISGGRTAAGLIGSYTDYGIPNVKKAGAAAVSAIIPGVPAWQEVMRASGVYLNPKLASFTDLIIPLPTSGARRVNVLGDDVSSPSAIQHVIQTLSGGTYPGPVSPKAVQQSQAYRNLFVADWFPPAIAPARGFNFSGTLRPMNSEELSRYTQARGTRLKAELTGLDVSSLTPDDAVKVVKDAYVRANDRALQDVGAQRVGREEAGGGGGSIGIGTSEPRATGAGSAPSVSSAGGGSRIGFSTRGGGVRAPGPPRVNVPRGTGFSLGPSTRGFRALRAPTGRLRTPRRGGLRRPRGLRLSSRLSRPSRLRKPRLKRAA